MHRVIDGFDYELHIIGRFDLSYIKEAITIFGIKCRNTISHDQTIQQS